MSGNIILITGGVKSGKTKYAQTLADRLFEEKTYLATAECIDGEMEKRIQKHRAERDGSYTTIEEPVRIDKYARPNLILDCLTVWMNNIFHYKREDEWEGILKDFLDGLTENAIIISNETGLGNIPPTPLPVNITAVWERPMP